MTLHLSSSNSNYNIIFTFGLISLGKVWTLWSLWINWLIGLVGRVFANGPGDQGSIPGRVIPKTLKKWYLIPSCLTLSIIRYVSRVKGSNPGKGVAPSPTPSFSSYWKGNLRVSLDYICQLYLLTLLLFYKDGFGVK